MGALNAITNDALLNIVEWGEGALRAAGAGETAWVLDNVAEVDQIVIDTNTPLHTKVVADVATVMTGPEQAAVDAAQLAASQSESIDDLVEVLDGNAVNEQLDVTVSVVIDWNSLDHKIELGGNLGTGDITFSNPPAAGMCRQITVEVMQDSTGSRTISDDAWTGVDWGTGGAPVFGTAAGTSRLIVLYVTADSICGFANPSLFGP